MLIRFNAIDTKMEHLSTAIKIGRNEPKQHYHTNPTTIGYSAHIYYKCPGPTIQAHKQGRLSNSTTSRKPPSTLMATQEPHRQQESALL
jgi:hypothetical protein